MNLMIAVMASLVLIAGGAQADEAEEQRCLQAKVQLTYPHMEYGEFGDAFIDVTVTNNLPYTISAVKVASAVKTEGRSMPWGEVTHTTKIAGGIEPGEQRMVTVFADYLPKESKQHPIYAETTILGVLDANGKPGVISCHVNPPTGEDM